MLPGGRATIPLAASALGVEWSGALCGEGRVRVETPSGLAGVVTLPLPADDPTLSVWADGALAWEEGAARLMLARSEGNEPRLALAGGAHAISYRRACSP